MSSAPSSRILGLLGAGVGVGALSGLLGVGGGILMVPLLVLTFAFRQKRAQATSLAAITLAAVSGAVSYGAAGDVLLLPAALIAAGGLVGTFVGGALLHRLSERQVRAAFAVLMVIVALRLVLGGTTEPLGEVAGTDPLVIGGYFLAGLAMGALSALMGVGGGVVLVPTLILLFSLSPHQAQGTSLAVMVPVSLMGAWRNARHGYTDWRAGWLLGAGGVLGAPAGAALAHVLPAEWLQRIFALLLIFSAFQLFRQARQRGTTA